ncbi:dihydropteroate synthase [Pseudorhizobium endolithicum]|uniref:Dihydropteroate synthase n=2 Tax=Pseudorhizobium endolithicum TaxID=1191678 RepID=A0ABN7JSJ4_9HYPH|nr:dihydropteroate synthase [Pseudorhizobium endolithicum]CAD7045379.1 dihydropteroate synthase [Pseudorhizobium endolithicum]
MRYSRRNDAEPAPRFSRDWKVGRGRVLELGNRGHIMAIINVTPDSFSDGGLHLAVQDAVAHGLACAGEGAAILDVGGESTRPGAAPVSAVEEQDRVLPVIEQLARQTDALISVDTYRAETARLAVAAGAHVINDVHGLQREPDVAAVAAELAAGLCIMHTGRGREGEIATDVIEDQRRFFGVSLGIADAAGVDRDAVVLDPGFGFAKNAEENLELMARFRELQTLGLPWLVGTSRKRFIGSATGREKASDRDVGTAATTAILRLAGAAIFRVHDVAANRDALAIADAVLQAQETERTP